MALVLLHPLPLDDSCWSEEFRGLDETIVAPTLYGLGESIDQWAAGVVDMAGPGRHTIVGNSVGGSCAVEIAHLAPDRVERMVLVGAKPGHRPEPAVRDEAIRVLAEEGIDAAWARYWAPLFGPTAAEHTVEAAKRCLLAQSVDDIIRGVRVFHGRPDRDIFARCWVGRMDVVSGEHDRTPIPTRSADLAASAPDGRFHLLAGVGHYVPLEAPSSLAAIIAEE